MEADLLEILEVAQPTPDSEVVAVVDRGLGAQRAPCLELLLDAGLLVVEVQGGVHPGRDHARAEARRRALADPALERQLHLVGAPDVEVLVDDLLEEHAPLLRAVEDLRERELRLQDGELVRQPRSAVCSRERMRQPRQPLARQGLDLGGAELAAELCQPLGILAAQDAVVERFEGDALLGQLALEMARSSAESASVVFE